MKYSNWNSIRNSFPCLRRPGIRRWIQSSSHATSLWNQSNWTQSYWLSNVKTWNYDIILVYLMWEFTFLLHLAFLIYHQNDMYVMYCVLYQTLKLTIFLLFFLLLFDKFIRDLWYSQVKYFCDYLILDPDYYLLIKFTCFLL